jgi:hypothetical protein
MLIATETDHTVTELVRRDRKAFRRLYVVAFTLFFVIAALSRLLPRAWRPLAVSTGPGESIYAEAARVASTVIPYAFSR